MSASHMTEALALARQAAEKGEVPVGAVVVDSVTGEIVSTGINQMIISNDPTGHAEIVAIRAACEAKQTIRLPECDIYVSLEPCPMCAQAIAFARIRRVYFAAFDPKGGGVDHGALIFQASSCHHKPEVYGGIQEREAQEMLQQFFQDRR